MSRRWPLVAPIIAATLVLLPGRAGADLSTILDAIQQARGEAAALGYSPCDPDLVALDKYGPRPEAWAWAGWPETFGICEVGWSSEVPEEEVLPVARHEVCHLATGPRIARDEALMAVADPYHAAPEFQACLRDIGGVEPVPVIPTIGIWTDGGYATTDAASLEEDPEDDARLCADLAEVKPWIDWGCPK